jgi:hypothetical protein
MNWKAQVVFGVVLGIALLASVAMFPVEDDMILESDRKIIDNSFGNESEEEILNIRAIHYENLSDQGKEAYIKVLESEEGRYVMDKGEEPSDFPFVTPSEYGQGNVKMIAIKRPENDSHLPPADESEDQTRYDQILTYREKPPRTSEEWFPRYIAIVLGVVSLGRSGHVLFKNIRSI